MLGTKWGVVLLNGLQLSRPGVVITRFRTQKTGELMAFLALHSHRLLPREEIAGVIWPDHDVAAGRASLRTSLASLRHQLEPPGTVANSVVFADRVSVHLNPEAFTTDVAAFEAACRLADSAPSLEARLQAAMEAVGLYTGDLLPGQYAEWILSERARLAQSYSYRLHQVIRTLRDENRSEQALPYAHRLIAANACEEEGYLLVMQLSIEAEQPREALHCFENWKRISEEALGATPSSAVCVLADRIRQSLINAPHVFPQSSDAAPTSTARLSETLSGDIVVPKLPSMLDPRKPLLASASAPTELPAARLPLPLTRFFGRDTEILQVARLLAPSLEEWNHGQVDPVQRLVTLTGVGGTGKTRFAIEVARRLHSSAALPVTFVPLADITEPARLPEAIAKALMLPMGPQDGLLDRVVAALAERQPVRPVGGLAAGHRTGRRVGLSALSCPDPGASGAAPGPAGGSQNRTGLPTSLGTGRAGVELPTPLPQTAKVLCPSGRFSWRMDAQSGAARM